MNEMEEFEGLYRATRIPVLRYLLGRTPDPEDAADLLAEVYVVAWARRDERPNGDEARPWLFGVARRVLAEHARHAVRRRAAADDLRGHLRRDATGSPGSAREEAVARDDAVAAALAGLAEVDRELIRLTVWDGLSTAQAATVVGLRPGTARVRLLRARSRLRDVLGGLGAPNAQVTGEPPEPGSSSSALSPQASTAWR